MYFGNFNNWDDVMKEFEVEDPSIYQDVTPLFASYDTPGYEGSALVIFLQKGKIWLVSSSHCSCYGLEGTFNPEEMSVEALIHMMEKGDYGYYTGEGESNLTKTLNDLLSIKGWKDMSPDELAVWLKLKY